MARAAPRARQDGLPTATTRGYSMMNGSEGDASRDLQSNGASGLAGPDDVTAAGQPARQVYWRRSPANSSSSAGHIVVFPRRAVCQMPPTPPPYDRQRRRRLEKTSGARFLPSIPLTFGSRAFHIAAPKIWNSLPSNSLECQTLLSFGRHLKTYYFQSAYPAPSTHPQCILILF